MIKGQRWRLAVCLAAVLITSGSGCYPAATTGTGSAPTTTKPDNQPNNKEKPGKQPKPDVG